MIFLFKTRIQNCLQCFNILLTGLCGWKFCLMLWMLSCLHCEFFLNFRQLTLINLGSALFCSTMDDEFFLKKVIHVILIHILGSVYSKLFIFISLHNKWIVSLSNFFVLGICELYIVQYKLGVDIWIFINIQWSLFMNMCWRHFWTHVHYFPMIAYVCCSYPNDCNFSTYNICITLLRCWSFSYLFGSRKIFSST